MGVRSLEMSTIPVAAGRVVETGHGCALRRILCPIDFSPASSRAVAEAVALARASRGEITILFVLPCAPPSRDDRPPISDELTSAVAKDVEALVEPARAVGIPVRVCLRVGDPAREILRNIERALPDIVVMGTHGLGGFKRWALGSVASEVLRGSRSPVLTVAGCEAEASATPVSPHRDSIVCAVSLSASSSRTIAVACAVARAMSARLTLVHVLAADDARLAREAAAKLHAAATLAAAYGLDAKRVEEAVVAGSTAREILRLSAARSAGMLVIGGHRLAPGTLPGSIPDEVIRGARCSVVTVRGGP